MKQKSSRNLFFWLQNGIVVKNLQFNHSVVTFLPTLTPHSPGEEDACLVYFFVLSHGWFCLISQRKQMLLSVISAKWGEIFSNGVLGSTAETASTTDGVLLNRQGRAGGAEGAGKSPAGSTAMVFRAACGRQAFPGPVPSQGSRGCASRCSTEKWQPSCEVVLVSFPLLRNHVL